MMNTLISHNPTRTSRKNGMKKIALIMAVAASAIFSVNASAAQDTSIEGAVSSFVVMQGKQVMNELNVQLQQSIELEVQSLAASLLKHTSISSLSAEDVANTETNKEQTKLVAKVPQDIK